MPDGQIPAQGGEGTVNVSASRDCTWSAAAEGSWLTITAGRSGQGDGAVTFRAAENADPASRRGAVVLNETRVEIVQAAAACEFSLNEPGAVFAHSGGAGHVDVQASSGMCAWTASSDVPWVQLGVRDGRGSGRVTFEVQPASGPGRSARLTIAGQPFTITQSDAPSASCTYQVEPRAVTLPGTGGSAPIRITTAPGCGWTAASAAPWISIAGAAAGSGPGTVTLAASGSPGPARTGSAIVAGQPITVSQLADTPPAPAPPAPPPPAPPAACTYALSPERTSLPSTGGAASFTLETASNCSWTAASTDAWITVLDRSGTGRGTIRFEAPANAGASRSGVIVAGGRTFTVQQAGGCAFTLSATTRTLPAEGGSASVDVTTAGSCSWTAASRDNWITIVEGAAGQGNGTVRFSAAAYTGTGRTGTLDVAGQPVTVVQTGACTFTINPSQDSIGASGGQLVVSVTTTAGCAWTAATTTSWIQITQGASGTGNGEVRLSVAPNSGTAARTGTATIAGRTFTVTQNGSPAPPDCRAEVSPGAVDAPANGGNVQLRVTIGSSCSWQSEPDVPWIRVTAGSQNTGDGPVLLQIQSNPGPPRTGTVIVAGVPVPVRQQGQ